MASNSEDGKNLLGGHRARLRARLEQDPQGVADYEVMELLLGLSILRKDTKILARQLLERFGGMRGALDARDAELRQLEGFGPGLLSLWHLIREVMARYAASPLLEREVLSTPEAVMQMARSRLGNYVHEESWVALVDAQNRLISWERLKRGSVSFIAMQPRDVLEIAIKRDASGIILVHNHPGGSPYPSRADLDLTEEIEKLAQCLNLRFLDHLIITAGDCYSIGQKKILR